MSKTICQEVSSRCKDADIADFTGCHMLSLKMLPLPDAVSLHTASWMVCLVQDMPQHGQNGHEEMLKFVGVSDFAEACCILSP